MSKYVIPRIDEPIMTPNGTMSLPWYLYLKQGGSGGGGGGGGGGGSTDNYIPPMLSYQRSDHKLNDIEWLRGDTFSWHDGGVYFGAYQHLVDDFGDIPGGWSYPVNPLSNTYSWRDMAYGDGKYVAISYGGKTGVSTNLISWTEYTSSENGLGSHSWGAIIWDGTRFVTIGGSGGGTNPVYFATSSDGVSWTVSTISGLDGISMSSLVWDGTKYLAYGSKLQDYYVMTSTDGTTWTTTPISSRASAVTKGRDKFVMVGYYGTVATSTDGTNWTDQGDPLNIGSPGNSWSAVGFNGFQYVALSQEGYYATSPDGINWTTPVAVPSLSSAYRQWDCLTYDGQQLVSLGYSGYITKYTQNSSSETISGVTISYYAASDGHKICLADQHDNVMSVFNLTGDAWYYILDTTNHRFKLPRRRSRKLIRSYNNESSWYRLYADGWVEQGGVVTNSARTVEVQLPVPMAGNSYTAFTDLNYANTGWSATVNAAVLTKTTTSITIQSWYNSSFTTGPIGWGIAGYSAIDTSGLQGGEKYTYFFVGLFTDDAIKNTAGLNTEMFNDLNAHKVIAFQVPTAENGHTWFRLYADGWVEQGGISYASALGHRVVLPIKMLNGSYTLTLGNSDSSGDASLVVCGYRSKSTDDFIVDCGYGGTFYASYVNWQVSGMAAQGD